MKPILFDKDENTFTSNGLGRLDCLSCKVTEERNGMYELEAEVPINGKHTSEIKPLSIIGVIPYDGGDIQAFTVYKVSKPINGRFKVYARHISYRLSDIPCSPFAVEAGPGAAAATLAGLKTNALESCPFNFYTDVTTANPYTQVVPASIRQRLGGVEGSVLDQFGGEYEWDNFDVHLWKARGRLANVTGITLRYGKNIVDINQEEEIANTVTGIMPYWVDTEGNNLVTLPEKIVYADNADLYPYHITQVVDFSSYFQDKPTVSQLRTVATTYVHKDGFGEPNVSIEVTPINLWESEEYKGVAPIERIQLCDEITVDFELLGIQKVAKVVKTVWDVLEERYDSVQIGHIRTTLAQAVTDRDNSIDTAFIDQLTRINGAISDATAWLTAANGYVVAVKNDDGSWKELLFMNTNNPQTATLGIRINENGIGFWDKAYDGGNVLDGPYGTAWTMNGRIGDFANKNFWNMRTGQFSLSASTTVGGSTVQEIADGSAAAAEAEAKEYTDAIKASLDGDISDLQNQIDGNITTWFYDYQPTTSNVPASTWTTVDDKINHIGDLFYWSSKGYAYRWQVKSTAADPTHPTANDFEWVQISDSAITEALAKAQEAEDLADNKRRVFVAQPVPPYDVGDLWVQGTSGDILRCQTAKTSSQTYSSSDWIKASKYTDDTYVTNWITTTYTSDKSNLQGQIDGKAETWYQATDPATAWTSADEKAKHVGDLWYKTANGENTTWIYQLISGTYQWVQENVPKAVFDKIDGKAQIFISQPTPPYYVGDMWLAGTSSAIMVCTTARSTGNYIASDWAKRDKYVDSSDINSAINTYDGTLDQNEVFNRLIGNDTAQGIVLDNGKLYLRGEYLTAGAINVGGSAYANNPTLTIKDTNNTIIGYWTKDGIYSTKGHIGSVYIDSSSLYISGYRKIYDEYLTVAKGYDNVLEIDPVSLGITEDFTLRIVIGITSQYIYASYGTLTLWHEGGLGPIDTIDNAYYETTFACPSNRKSYVAFDINPNKRSTISSANIVIDTNLTKKTNITADYMAGNFRGLLEGSAQLSDLNIGGVIYVKRRSSDGNITGLRVKHWNYERYTNISSAHIDLENESDDTYIRVNSDTSTPNIERYYSSTTEVVRWQSSSDERVKENIEPLDMEISKSIIDYSKPKSFKFKNREGKHYGMIAQDARKLLDDLGEQDATLEFSQGKLNVDDQRAIDYEQYIAHVINYLHYLEEKTEKQQSEIDELKEIIKNTAV